VFLLFMGGLGGHLMSPSQVFGLLEGFYCVSLLRVY